ncbi:MAG: hypothetical protein Harvfovirus44_6 [Harvfovirus sp.]|uniref:HNH nuclease domain-containing protein n=1 Tax=Harvfovirus sp. TaxID=2487768 RepID=A0A3G5A303_9VIRU|nr:MAG: hypothetical protein Harvfovirus44_6 [Harvfovirus sp.]
MATDKVIWKDVVRIENGVDIFEGFYEVSNDGQIREKKTQILKSASVNQKSKTLKTILRYDQNKFDPKISENEIEDDEIDDDDDDIVDKTSKKSNAKGKKNVEVHIEVAVAHLGPRPKGYIVYHKDGNKENNNVSNLMYVSPQKFSELQREKQAPKAKFTLEQISAKFDKVEVKDIPTFSSHCIDKNGNVYSKSTNKLLQTAADLRISIRRDDDEIGTKPRSWYIYQLLTLAFYGDPNKDDPVIHDLPPVIHINGDKKDNTVDNLRWGTITKKGNGKKPAKVPPIVNSDPGPAQEVKSDTKNGKKSNKMVVAGKKSKKSKLDIGGSSTSDQSTEVISPLSPNPESVQEVTKIAIKSAKTPKKIVVRGKKSKSDKSAKIIKEDG